MTGTRPRRRLRDRTTIITQDQDHEADTGQVPALRERFEEDQHPILVVYERPVPWGGAWGWRGHFFFYSFVLRGNSFP